MQANRQEKSTSKKKEKPAQFNRAWENLFNRNWIELNRFSLSIGLHRQRGHISMDAAAYLQEYFGDAIMLFIRK